MQFHKVFLEHNIDYTRMKALFAIVIFTLVEVRSSPFDNGKYNSKKYQLEEAYDDGRYYRPFGEGKYIPGDEGKYTYIYRQGLYPGDDGDYRYIHQEGLQGHNGPNDGGYFMYADKYPYIHQVGPQGPSGGNGPNGPFGPKGGSGPDGPDNWLNRPHTYQGDETTGRGYYGQLSTEQLQSVVCKNFTGTSNLFSSSELSSKEGLGKHDPVETLYKLEGSKTIKGSDQLQGKTIIFKYHITVTVSEKDDADN